MFRKVTKIEHKCIKNVCEPSKCSLFMDGCYAKNILAHAHPVILCRSSEYIEEYVLHDTNNRCDICPYYKTYVKISRKNIIYNIGIFILLVNIISNIMYGIILSLLN